MQNFPKISALIMVVGLVASVYLSRTMRSERVTKYEIGSPTREKMVYLPCFGFDKFYADIKWMQCINELGGVKGAIDESKANYFNKQFQRITDLDPDFHKIYEVGAATIAYTHNAELALALVDKAEGVPEKFLDKSDKKFEEKKAGYAIKKHWYRTYQAAHWIIQVRARKAQGEERKKHLETAIEYLRKSVDADSPWYVENMLLHTVAKLNGDYGDSYREAIAWEKYYNKRMDEFMQSSLEMSPEGGEGGEGGEAPVEDMYAMDMEVSPAMTRLRKRIIDRCRELMAAYVTGKEKPADLDKRKKTIRGIFDRLNTDSRYSPVSLASYAAGDLFDRVTGTPLVPYGIDLYDYEVNGRIYKSVGGDNAYNTLTGKKVVTDFGELAKALGKDPVRLKKQYELYKEQEKAKAAKAKDK